MEDKISVIVATYNQEDTIARTLDSVLMQQCHVPIEIILGEDCSTDGTLAVCQRYADEHPDVIRLIANKQNKGLVDNYFDCILAAQGKYIADCAGDDFWTDPLKLEKEVCVMEQHPNVNMVLTRWNWFNETTRQISPGPTPPFPDGIIKGSEMLEPIVTQTNMNVYHLCTSLYRRDGCSYEAHRQGVLYEPGHVHRPALPLSTVGRGGPAAGNRRRDLCQVLPERGGVWGSVPRRSGRDVVKPEYFGGHIYGG